MLSYLNNKCTLYVCLFEWLNIRTANLGPSQTAKELLLSTFQPETTFSSFPCFYATWVMTESKR